MLDEHTAMCEFALLPCPNECKDGKQNGIQRNALDRHLEHECRNREYTCACGLKGPYDFMEKQHVDKECPKKIVSCPNEDCTETMEQLAMKEHAMEECCHRKISCKYKQLGCSAELKKADMEEHELDGTLHLRMALDTTTKLFNRLTALEDDGPTNFTFKLEGYIRLKERNGCFNSPSFYTSLKGYRMCITVYPNGNGAGKDMYVSIYLHLQRSLNDRPFGANVVFTLLNQHENRNHFSKTKSVDCGVPIQGIDTFIPHTELRYDHNKNTQYLNGDTLYFRVTVKLTNNWLRCTEVFDN